MDNNMKKRWISLYVENQVGVLSKISGLFSGKCYNLDSLTVGTTEDPTVSRMTIATVSDDETFEQIKKQLNRMIEVIKVIDFTDVFVRMKEILYVKVLKCTPEDKVEIFQIAETFKAKVIDYGKDSLLVEFVQTATKNDAVVKLMKEEFTSKVDELIGEDKREEYAKIKKNISREMTKMHDRTDRSYIRAARHLKGNPTAVSKRFSEALAELRKHMDEK